MLLDRNTTRDFNFSLDLIEEGEIDSFINKINDEIVNNAESVKILFKKSEIEELYQVNDRDGEKKGLAAVANYGSKEKAKEILICPFISLDKEDNRGYKKELISFLINEILKDKDVEFILIKAEENDKDLINILESMGFIRDGLFISNQLSGEFIYYYVYSYKLI